MDESLLIGKKDGLPWHIPEDLKRFNSLTKGYIVVMGRNTYFSLPEKYRPLPHRRNIVITREAIDVIETFSSIENFLDAMKREWTKEVMVIGGATIYNQFFKKWLVDTVELTLVDGKHDGDIFVEEFRDGFVESQSEAFEWGRFITLTKK